VKVLILHQHFNTPEKGGPLRSYYLAKSLIQGGIEVSIITARKQALYSRENIEGIDVHYLPIAYDNKFGFYKRGISFLRYALNCVRIAGKIPDISICYAISVPLTVGQAALWIKKTYKIPFIFEVGDLWPDAPIQLGFIQHPVLQRSLYWLEKHIYRNALSIVALSEPIKAAIQKKAPEKNVVVIPNIADTQYYSPQPKDRHLEEKFGLRGQFVVSYIGAVGFANGLDYYLECARASEKAGLPVRFLLCGEGGSYDQLKRAAENLKLRNIEFIPFTNREGVRKILNVTDAAFISYRPFQILETGSPNKYFDGLAAGKLIVINFKGWIKDEIENEKCGVALDSKYPHDFAKKIFPFLEDNVLQNQYRRNARMLAEKKYSRLFLGEKLKSVLTS
jgi:glycosyltransferase involved in cell wall biosynthesis